MNAARGDRVLAPLRRAVWAATRSARAQDFSPAAMDVIENQPSPVKMAMMLTICALFATAILAATFLEVDIHAVGPGRVQAVGRSKIIQPLDGGKVSAIFVSTGSHVVTGDQLVLLDATEVLADRRENEGQYAEQRAEIARRQAAIDAAQRNDLQHVPRINFPADIEIAIQEREQAVLGTDLRQLKASVDSLDAKLTESLTQAKSLGSTIAAQKALIATLQQRLSMRQSLEAQHWETQANVLDATETLDREKTSLTDHEGQLQQALATARSVETQKAETVAKFISDNGQAMETAQAKRDSVREEVVKAADKAAHTVVIAPVDGTVQELTVTTIGQVLNRGQQLMTIVPDAQPIEIEALVSNTDIGFVSDGQPAVIKVDTFPFSIYGTVSGRVSHVSRDAVYAGNIRQALPTASQAAQPEGEQGIDNSSVPGTRDLVFPVTIVLDVAKMSVGGKDVALSPGMTVSADILTGRRKIISYLLAPLWEISSDAIHER